MQRLRRTNDIQTGLLASTDCLADVLKVPQSTFTTHPNGVAKCKFAYPFAATDEDLKFESYYGNISLGCLRPGMRTVAVSKQSPDSQPRECYLDDIRQHVAQCIDSVAEADTDCATLSIDLQQVFFAVNHSICADDEPRFLRHGATFDGQYDLKPNKATELTVARETCEWQGPSRVLDFLRSIGVQETSRERLDPSLSLKLRGQTLWNNMDGKSHLCLDNLLTLNPDTLAVESWRVQNWYTMSYHLMHARPSSNDVIIRTHVQRFASIEEIRGQGRHGPTLRSKPFLGGWLSRDGPNYSSRTAEIGVKMIYEYGPGERIHFKYRSVPFSVTLQPVTYLYFEHETGEFKRNDTVSCEPRLVFSLKSDRTHEAVTHVVEAVTHVAHSLLLKSNDPAVLPLKTSPNFYSDSDGSLLSEEFQAVLRLKFEEGSLRRLLGLDESASDASCRQKCSDLRSLVRRIRGFRVVRRLELDLDRLMEKLALAEREIE